MVAVCETSVACGGAGMSDVLISGKTSAKGLDVGWPSDTTHIGTTLLSLAGKRCHGSARLENGPSADDGAVVCSLEDSRSAYIIIGGVDCTYVYTEDRS